MPCKYCSAPVTSSTTCSDCDALVQNRSWTRLAHRWLAARPEDWVPDVAAFLELSADPIGVPGRQAVRAARARRASGESPP